MRCHGPGKVEPGSAAEQPSFVAQRQIWEFRQARDLNMESFVKKHPYGKDPVSSKSARPCSGRLCLFNLFVAHGGVAQRRGRNKESFYCPWQPPS